MKSIKDLFRSYAEFDAAGRHVGGTDKESNHHYGDAYESLFGPCQSYMREEAKLVMEVGVADGSSLLAWGDVFPNATIVGMDIHSAARAQNARGIEFHIGNQRSQGDCERAAAGRQFDVIVEDATHELDATLMTLLFLWPFVRPGGMYVIEEFPNIGSLRRNVKELWRDGSGCGEAVNVRVVDTVGPSGGIEPLVVFRKPL